MIMRKCATILVLIFSTMVLTSCSGTQTLVVNFGDLRSDFLALEKTLQDDGWADQTHQETSIGDDQLRSDFLALEMTLQEEGCAVRPHQLAEIGVDRRDAIHRTTLAWNRGEGQQLR